MAMVILTDRGQVVAVDRRLLQPWSADAIARPLIERFSGIEPRERAALVAPRRAVREQARFFTVTADGQVKASEASEYARLSSDAMVGSLLREGDRFVAAFAGPARGNVLVASSLAKAIVFDIAELRPQGRKATGVRAIALDEGATAVSAFVCPDDGWLVLATAQGYFKRMRSAEFRAQGRGGGGLQTCRLGHGDTVTDLVSIDLAGDLLVLTSSGRYLRLAAYDVPLLGRSARGDRLVDLDAGERVVQLVAVPAG
jgi:DNA gyrase subunit A